MKLSKPHKQKLARAVREEHGVEVTPDEAEQLLTSAYTTIRQKLIDAGYAEIAAMTDSELREMVREAYR